MFLHGFSFVLEVRTQKDIKLTVTLKEAATYSDMFKNMDCDGFNCSTVFFPYYFSSKPSFLCVYNYVDFKENKLTLFKWLV